MDFLDREIQNVTTKIAELETPKKSVLPESETDDDATIEYRTTSRIHSQTSNPFGKSIARTTSIETKRTVSGHGDSDIFNKHLSLTTPDYLSGEVLLNTENNRMQTLRKLKSSFLSQHQQSEQPKPDPFARFGSRSMVDGNLFQEKSFIEIHKFPFAEPFSTPNSIRKEQVTYSTTTQGKSGRKISNITKTDIIGDNATCSVVEETEVIVHNHPRKFNESSPKIEEIKD